MTALIEGKYEILAKLKEGGMGAIYKVRHVLLDEVRVIKVMRPHIEEDADAQRRFQQEARMATSLKHPNIAALIDFAEDKDHTFYMVMEYIDGANLAEFSARTGTPPLPVALDIAVQTLHALAYLHRRGIVHRDISPENIMLTHDADGRVVVKLIDLGVAKQTGSQGMTVTGMFVGKLKYGSPEQLGVLKGGEKIDGRSDIYSLGCVLYQMLTGESAFNAESMQAYVMAHLMHPPRPFEETDPEGKVPEDVRAAVLKALAKSRDDRWASAEEFAGALEESLARLRAASGEESTAEMADLMRLAAQRTGVQEKPSGVSEAEARLARAFAGSTPAPRPSATPPPLGTPAPGASSRSVLPGGSVFPDPTARTVVPAAGEGFTPTARTVVDPASALLPSAPAATPAPVPARPAAAPARARLWVAAAAGLAALALVAVVVFGRGRVPATPSSGTVRLTAEPWGRLVRVEDVGTGKDVAVGEVVTPARVPLPAGTFRLTLRAAEGGPEAVTTVTVPAGGEVAAHAVIPGFDLDAAVSAYAR